MRQIFVDVETTGLDVRMGAEVRIVSINGEAWDVWNDYHKEHVFDQLAMQHDAEFVAHNAQFDLDFIYSLYPQLEPWDGPVFDTMVAWQMLHAGERIDKWSKTLNKYIPVRVPASLGYITERLLDVELDKSFQKGPWDGAVDDQMLRYAAEDTKVLEDLYRELRAGIKHAKLDKLFKLEMQLLPILLASKRTGIYVDKRKAKDLVQLEKDRAVVAEKQLPMVAEESTKVYEDQSTQALFSVAVTEVKKQLNARSPSQVAEYFGIEDAQEDTLRQYVLDTDDETAKQVMEVKKHLKRASSIEKQILKRIAKDGRVHPTFHQVFTDTGRLSSREPNLQNQDRSKDVRALFRPARGRKFVIADYSQLELRLAAYYSNDRTMINAYASGRDLHTETQRQIFGNPDTMDDEEKKKTRTLSKNINFGLVYGGGHGVLQRFAFKSGIILPEEEAIEYRRAFRAAYPGLVEWQGTEGRTNTSHVYTYLGRRRYIQPGEGFNARINNKIQGTAADGMKLAMVYLYRQHGILPIANIHDEVIIECDARHAESVATSVRAVMIEAMYRATGMSLSQPKVPIDVEVEIADSWAEK